MSNHLFWNILMRWTHISSAILLIGAVAFMRFFLVPAMASMPADQQRELWNRINKPWRMALGIAILAQIGSGIYWLLAVIDTPDKTSVWQMVFGIKMLAAFFFFFLISVLAGRAPMFDRFRQENRRWLSVTLILGAIIVACAAALYLMPDRANTVPAVHGSATIPLPAGGA